MTRALPISERGFKTRDGREIPDETTWHNIVVKKTGLASVCEQFVRKGTPILISGKIKNRKYTDQYGTEKYITEIHVDELELLGGKKPEQAPAPEPTYYASGHDDYPAD